MLFNVLLRFNSSLLISKILIIFYGVAFIRTLSSFSFDRIFFFSGYDRDIDYTADNCFAIGSNENQSNGIGCANNAVSSENTPNEIGSINNASERQNQSNGIGCADNAGSGENMPNEIDSSSNASLRQNVSNNISNQTIYFKEMIKTMLIELSAGSRKVESITKNGVARSVNSKIWNSFFQIYEIDNNNDIPGWYQCMLCREPVENTYGSGTTIKFHRHIEKCGQKNCDSQQTLDQYFNNVAKKPTKISNKHTEMLKNAAVQFVCDDLRPYHAIEGRGLFSLISATMELGKQYPNITPNDLKSLLPARNTVQRAVTSKSEDAKNMIKTKLHEAYKLAGGFACTADLWSDSYRQNNYLGITAHINLMDRNQIISQSFVISHMEVEEDSKTAEVVATHLFNVLMDYGFTRQQFQNDIDFVTDRGPNFKAIRSIRRANCFAHMINNTVQAFCNDGSLKTMLKDAKSLVKYMKRTGMKWTINFPFIVSSDFLLFTAIFFQISGLNFKHKLALKSYCSTRWSTVYIMLKSIIDGYQTIYNLLERRQLSGNRAHENCIDRIECLRKSTLRKVVDILRPFKEWTDCIEGDLDATIHHVWPTFIKMQYHLEKSSHVNYDDDDDFQLIERMKTLGRDYISKNIADISPTIEQKIAVVLNPKMRKMKRMDSNEREEVYRKIEMLIGQDTTTTHGTTSTQHSTQHSTRNSMHDFEDSDDDSSQDSTELSSYLSLKIEKESEIDLKEYWFSHRTVFPKLFKLFMRISCIPASSAPAERTFSISGAVITDRRSALLPKSVENLMLCRNLFRY